MSTVAIIFDVLRYLLAAGLVWMIVREFQMGRIMGGIWDSKARRDEEPAKFWLHVGLQATLAVCALVFEDFWEIVK